MPEKEGDTLHWANYLSRQLAGVVGHENGAETSLRAVRQARVRRHLLLQRCRGRVHTSERLQAARSVGTDLNAQVFFGRFSSEVTAHYAHALGAC